MYQPTTTSENSRQLQATTLDLATKLRGFVVAPAANRFAAFLRPVPGAGLLAGSLCRVHLCNRLDLLFARLSILLIVLPAPNQGRQNIAELEHRVRCPVSLRYFVVVEPTPRMGRILNIEQEVHLACQL